MEVIELTRKLGAAIQADERYKKFAEAKKASDNDADIQKTLKSIEKIRGEYQEAAMSENPDEKVMAKFDQEFQDAYSKLMASENMQAYETARQGVDDMMNYIMQILYLCVNGENPETCEPAEEEHNCGGDCCSCSGC